jgi:hypothetical protein
LSRPAPPPPLRAAKPQHVYKRVEAVCQAIRSELEYDIRLQQVPGLIPTSINLPGITAAEYCTNFLARLRIVLATYPPHEPTEPAVDLLVAVAMLERCVAGAAAGAAEMQHTRMNSASGH